MMRCGIGTPRARIVFLNFTPYSFIFLFFYLLSLLSLFSVSDFYVFWLVIEIMMLFFMGFCFSTFSLGFSSLIVYFLLQTISSLSLFVFYSFSLSLFFTFFLLLKLSMFPFYFWFLSVVYFFSNFAMFLSSSLHKLPSFLVIFLFFEAVSIPVLVLASLASLVFSFGFMLSTSDFRFLLLSSSVGNNGWFFLSALCSMELFIFYFLLYSFFLFLVISSFGATSLSLASHSGASLGVFIGFLVLLSGFPPLPLFFVKLFVVYYSSFFVATHYIFLFMAFSSLLLAGYFRFVLSLSVSCFSHRVSL